MTELPVYQFPSRPTPGLLFGLSAARLAAVGTAGVVLIVTLTRPTTARLATGVALIVLLAAAIMVKVGGRAVIDWLPIWVAFGWQQATRNNEFYTSPDLALPLPDLAGRCFRKRVCPPREVLPMPFHIWQLPFVDDHATTIAAGADDVWNAMFDTLDRAFTRPWSVRYAQLVGCPDVTASGPRPLAVGSTLPGFRVIEAVPPSQLVLSGRHRFTTGALIFRLEPRGPNRTHLTAETRAAFHGLAGRIYRLLVIGSGGHVVAVRRLLAAIERRSTPFA